MINTGSKTASLYKIPFIVSTMACLSAVSICAHSESLPAKFTAYYESSKGFISGKSVVSFKLDADNNYRYQSITTVTGVMSLFAGGKVLEQSNGKFVNGKVKPTKYIYKRTGKKERNVELKFDWKNQKVTNSINADPWKMKIGENTLDKLSYQALMMQDLQKNKTRQKKKLHYSVADGGKLKKYVIDIIGKEKITTKIGELETIKISRTNGRRTVTMWCAEKFGFLPVWISQEKKGGSSYTAKIFKLEGFPER